jgi:hypothetical protein
MPLQEHRKVHHTLQQIQDVSIPFLCEMKDTSQHTYISSHNIIHYIHEISGSHEGSMKITVFWGAVPCSMVEVY